MRNDLDPDNLPRGHNPIWIKPPKKATRLEMLKKVEKVLEETPEFQNYLPTDVMVLMYRGKNKPGARAEDWCVKKKWKLFEPKSVYGCEAKVVVLLDCLVYPEFITRGINLLVIVTNNR